VEWTTSERHNTFFHDLVEILGSGINKKDYWEE
jgi:hypothetical protein